MSHPKSAKPDSEKSSLEKANLKSAYDLMRLMEQNISQGFSSQDLKTLTNLLRSFSQASNLSLQRLSEIADHLDTKMSPRHFLNFLVPVERAIGKNLSEDCFLISSHDRKFTAPAKTVPMTFVLENIRSSFNVGSIFRLADCLAVEKIYLTGYTATPDQDSLSKTSLGAAANVAWKHFDYLSQSLEILRTQKIQIVALETAENSISLFDFKNQGPTAFVVGNERFGLEPDALKLCDQVLSIPTFGLKNSLNVSNALAVAAYHWRSHWK